jgi:hypothetical protein
MNVTICTDLRALRNVGSIPDGIGGGITQGTKVEGTINKLFEGHTHNFIECIHVEAKSERQESYMDLQLDVKDCKDVYDSFDRYCEVERLEGDNKYNADGHGLQVRLSNRALPNLLIHISGGLREACLCGIAPCPLFLSIHICDGLREAKICQNALLKLPPWCKFTLQSGEVGLNLHNCALARFPSISHC